MNKRRPRLLDFGAGIGTLTHAMAELGLDADFLCVEPDQKLRECIASWAQVAPSLAGGHWHGSVDLAFSSNVLEHIQDDIGTLSELSQCLRENGHIAIYVPALPCLWTAMDDHVGHYRRYTRRSLNAAARSAGLKVERITYVDSIGALATLVYKLLEWLHGPKPYQPPPAAALRFYDHAIWPLSRCLDPLLGNLFGKNLILFAQKA